MTTIYLKEKQFRKIQPIESFPNLNVIKAKIDGVVVRVHKASTITITLITEASAAAWYNVPLDTFIGRSDDGFFPTELIAGTNEKGFYSEASELAVFTGWKSAANLGTSGAAFVNFGQVVDILKKNNFKLIFK